MTKSIAQLRKDNDGSPESEYKKIRETLKKHGYKHAHSREMGPGIMGKETLEVHKHKNGDAVELQHYRYFKQKPSAFKKPILHPISDLKGYLHKGTMRHQFATSTELESHH